MKKGRKIRKMKKIFIVDGCLEIHPVKISEHEWKKPVFAAEINKQPIIAHPGRWSKFTTYAGFETMPEAEGFRDRIRNSSPPRPVSSYLV